MLNSTQRISLYAFIILSTLGFCLYAGFFSFYLVRIKTNPAVISMLIGATALSSLFWGPVAGRMIDRTRHKYHWLIIAQISCGVFIFWFGVLTEFRPLLTPVLVLLFSLTLNFAVIIINQYLLPMLHADYEKCVALASRATGLAVFLAGLILAALYNRLIPFAFFATASACYILSAAIVLLVLYKNEIYPLLNPDSEDDNNDKTVGIYQQSFKTIRRNWFLALSMCVLAFTETSFNTNFDVIAFSLGTTPYAVVFLLGALSGVLDSAASWIYPRLLGNTSIIFRWNFFLICFAFIFAFAALISFLGWNNTPYFLPCLAIILELTGVWWGIFISGRVRNTSNKNSYGQTMAAFRVPRSLVTFIGVTSIGTALQAGKLEWILLFNTVLLFALLAVSVFLNSDIKAECSAIEDPTAS